MIDSAIHAAVTVTQESTRPPRTHNGVASGHSLCQLLFELIYLRIELLKLGGIRRR